MNLHEIAPSKGANKSKKRVGRGLGCGLGKTSGRGTKGQKSRSGGGVRSGFEGGQMPIHRRLPKRGFKNINRKKILAINLFHIKSIEKGSILDEKLLRSLHIVKGKYDSIKLLGQGNIDFPIIVKLDKVSESAKKKIEAAGGRVEGIVS
ncbi:MAG: 50S ribosomal protein L15 [Desulfobacterales bacterium]|nr:50S ribosomal protein L15 [Desulfobacterales bacterium]